MARSSASSRSASRSSRSGGLGSLFTGIGRFASALLPDAAGARTLGIGILACVALGGVAFGIARGLPHLNAYAEARAMIDPSKVQIVFSDPPKWMPMETLNALSAQAHSAMASASPLEAGALQRVHQSLLTSGWFARVEQVRRQTDTEIAVEGEFRVPFAMVRVGDEDHLIDVAGRRLPLSYVGAALRPHLPLIVGVSMPMPAEPGGLWLGSDLRAALNLAGLLRDRTWFVSGQIHAIDASRFGREGIVELITDRQTRIVWGGDPLDRSLSEMPADRKLACLDALYRASRRVDDASGRTLDLRFDVVTLAPKAPITSAQESDEDSSFATND
jgi:hypothetical protein